jgi:Mg-chelatase subunit ChlD
LAYIYFERSHEARILLEATTESEWVARHLEQLTLSSA